MVVWKSRLIFLVVFSTTTCQKISTTELALTTETSWTTELPENDSCPFNFTLVNSTCYILADIQCPYYLPLPFDEIDMEITKIVPTFKLQVNKDDTYNYYIWGDILGNYGKLFASTLTTCNSNDENIAVEFDETNVTYHTTNRSENYLCAYNSLDNQPNATYCQLFDTICAKNTALDSTNCHCRNLTGVHFCETGCDNNTIFNETVCSVCQDILSWYENPEISLQVNYDNQFIYVSIDSYLKLLVLNSTSDGIVYCYTNADNSLNDVTFRYDVDGVNLYNTSYKQMYYQFYPLENLIGHYWCEGFSFNQAELNLIGEGNTIIAQSGDRESFTMNITVEDNDDPCLLTIHETTKENILEIVKGIVDEVHFLQLYEKDYSSNTRKIGYRLYFTKSNDTMTKILNDVESSISKYMSKEITLTPSYCIPDSTQLSNNINLTWEKTLFGMTTIPNELCLQNDSKPVTRTCLGEYLYGIFWSEVDGTCVNNSGELFGSKHTVSLHSLSHSGRNSTTKIKQLQQILSTGGTPIIVDVHFMSQIFENITLSNDTYDLTSLLEIASDMMDLNREALQNAQVLLNSTDMMLYNLAILMGKNNFNWTNGSFQKTTKNIFVQVSKLSSKNPITGVAIYETGNNVTIQSLNTSTDLDNLDPTDLKLVAFITGSQIQQLIDVDIQKEAKLIITVFRHDSFFNVNSNPTTTGFLVGMYISGFEEPFMYDYVRVLIKPDRKYRANLYCNRWEYGRDKLWCNRPGYWRNDSEAEPWKDLYACKFWTMKNFSILLGQEGGVILSIIAVIGCALSMFGSLAVIVTGIIYKTWRERSGTKILLNFVLTNFLQNIFLAVSSEIDSYKNPNLCIFIGACLHYFVLSQFAWMVIIGYLQYLRYVKVYFVVNTSLLLSTSIASWILPIIPVITVLSLDSSFYIQEEFCYLQNNPLIYGVLLPVVLTLITNGLIFMAIFINVCCKNYMTTPRDNMSWLNLRLILLLFFLLGLYWVFGILARFTNLIAFDYFFCISAGLQGFVVFLYFIVFNKMTKNFWMRQLKLSEMIAVMQIWLQQKKKIGRITIDRKRSKSKVLILRSLRKSEVKDEDLKLT